MARDRPRGGLSDDGGDDDPFGLRARGDDAHPRRGGPPVGLRGPDALTGQDLLASSGYVGLMIAHGRLRNLERVLASARAEHNAGLAKPSELDRVEGAIEFRRDNGCPDVPSHAPCDGGAGVVQDLGQP